MRRQIISGPWGNTNKKKPFLWPTSVTFPLYIYFFRPVLYEIFIWMEMVYLYSVDIFCLVCKIWLILC